jgi:MFS family permease
VLIAKVGKYKMAVLAGWAILALGCGLLELFNTHTKPPQWIFITAVSGLGGGILFTALTIAAQAHVSQEHIGIAAALTPFVRAVVSKPYPRHHRRVSRTLT